MAMKTPGVHNNPSIWLVGLPSSDTFENRPADDTTQQKSLCLTHYRWFGRFAHSVLIDHLRTVHSLWFGLAAQGGVRMNDQLEKADGSGADRRGA